MLRDILERIPSARLAFVGDGPERDALEKYFSGTRTVFMVRARQQRVCGDAIKTTYSVDAGLVQKTRCNTTLPVTLDDFPTTWCNMLIKHAPLFKAGRDSPSD